MNDETKTSTPERGRPFDAAEMLHECDGGLFMQKIAEAIKHAGLGAVMYGRKGTVTITLSMEQIGESSQVQMKHKVKSDTPTKRGKVVEEDETATPLYVSAKGRLSVMPDNQESFSFMDPKRG